jgi:hypothetical protein
MSAPGVVRLDRTIDQLKPCHDNLAIIRPGRGPHAAELKCATCNAHRGWLSKTTFEFLTKTVRLFGVPTEPFCIHNAFTQNEQDTQMKISEMFPSPWLAAADLNNTNVTVEIEDVTYEAVGKDQEKKPIAKFKGKSKRLILNKTNCRAIAALYGDDSRAWPQNPITLFPTMTQVGDEPKPCIRAKRRRDT